MVKQLKWKTLWFWKSIVSPVKCIHTFSSIQDCNLGLIACICLSLCVTVVDPSSASVQAHINTATNSYDCLYALSSFFSSFPHHIHLSLPVSVPAHEMPSKTQLTRVLSLQRQFFWFPLLLNYSDISMEISGITPDWNSCNWEWNCPCVSIICRRTPLTRGGWYCWTLCTYRLKQQLQKFFFLHPLHFLITTQASNPITFNVKAM